MERVGSRLGTVGAWFENCRADGSGRRFVLSQVPKSEAPVAPSLVG